MTPAPALRAYLWSRAWALARARAQDAQFEERFSRPPKADLDTPPPTSAADLGDELERLRDTRREAEFKSLIAGTTKARGHHGNATTQRFTPAWIARWLATRGLHARQAGPSRCLDPACGGGHLLLALLEAGVPPADLHGVDLDPVAVDVARWSLWLRARRPGDERGDAEATLEVVDPPLGTLGAALGTYGLVIANPPYMGARHLDPATRQALRDRYAPYHGDLYTAFLGRCLGLTEPGGAVAFLCQHSFLFLARDRALRRDFLRRAALREVLHLGPHAFPGISGEKASVVAFTATVGGSADVGPTVVDLRDLRDADAKRRAVDAPARRFDGGQAARRASAGGSFAYWVPGAALRRLDRAPFLGDVLDVAGSSHKTADNARFVHHWWEVPEEEIGPGRRFVRYAKGGSFRRWHGNLERVVDWSDEARSHYATHTTANLLPERYWYREGITWSDFGGLRFSARHLPPGCAFDMAGPALFVGDAMGSAPSSLLFWLGLLNTDLVCGLLNALNPTIHYQVGDLRRLPIPEHYPDETVARVIALTQQALDVTRSIDHYATPAAPDYLGPRLWMEEGTTTARIAAATRWWSGCWDTLGQLRGQIETCVSVLYGLDSDGSPDPVPRTPDWLRLARDHVRGQREGRYAQTPLPSDFETCLTRSSAAAIFSTPWHPSRLAT